jgi:hypothetical protein
MPDDLELNEGEVSDAMSENELDYDDDMDIKDEHDYTADPNASSEGAGEGAEWKVKYDPKDPARPRRKKARRACWACQRAHLTCGKPTSNSTPSFHRETAPHSKCFPTV